MSSPTQKSKRGPGRPRKSAKDIKGCPVSLSLTDGQYDHFKAIADRLGRPLAPTIVSLAMKGRVVAPLSKEDADAIRKANGMCNNLNQLAHQAHLTGTSSLERDIRTTLDTLNTTLLNIRK